jgi:hypothetical protein
VGETHFCATIGLMEGYKERFYNVYNNLPLGIRDEVILVIGGEPVSWKIVKLEVDNNTPLSKEMLEKLISLGFI